MKFTCIKTGINRTNTYIIENNGEAIVVDPGCDVGKIDIALKEINAVPKYVIITHTHFDHVGGVSALQKMGAKVYVSSVDYKLLKDADFYIRLGFGDEPVESFDADVEVNDGDVFTLLGHEFKVLATPGHTPGGVCYIMDGTSIFSGDTLFRLCIGRTDFPQSSHSEMMSSIKKLFALDGNYDVYPGHDKATTLDFERKYNPYAKA
ncbi:MAG: MBL fold metallo-hydrolase [Clostridiales bacterium]|nr:MBL fold metallo-hydrolase [Clostridiales bacterium]